MGLTLGLLRMLLLALMAAATVMRLSAVKGMVLWLELCVLLLLLELELVLEVALCVRL